MQDLQEQIARQTSLKIKECIKGMEEKIDSSFNRIENFLDKTIDDIEQLFNQRFQQQQQQQQTKDPKQNRQLPQLSSPDIKNQQFNNQLVHQVTSLVKVQKQQFEDIIKNKDKQLQSQNLYIQQLKQTQSQISQPIIQPSPQLILKPFTYQLIQNNSIKQDNTCNAIAINKDCSIVIAGCGKEIKVFELKQEVLKKTQLLSEHQDDVNTLNFMKRSNHFISGSDDESIIIWSMNQSNQWICQQKLNGHNLSVYCLVLNNNEDLIISGSQDKTIKFWTKQNQWLCQQTITDHTERVFGLSLNQQQNKVISCGYDAQILIIEQSQQDSQWIVIQKIKVEKVGHRICFINDNLFTFQPDGIEQMHVYEMNNTNKQYLKTKDILVKGGGSDNILFPQQHIKQKCLLVNRNNNYVNLIRTKENGEFKTEQSIEFGHYSLCGCMSEDGQYLISWDGGSEEIQIRKYNEI